MDPIKPVQGKKLLKSLNKRESCILRLIKEKGHSLQAWKVVDDAGCLVEGVIQAKMSYVSGTGMVLDLQILVGEAEIRTINEEET